MRYRAECLFGIVGLAPALIAASYEQEVAPLFARYCVQCDFVRVTRWRL